MEKQEIEAIRERDKKAKRGPWEAQKREPLGSYVVRPPGDYAVCEVFPQEGKYDAWANSDFIAHARDDVPALLDEIERLRGALNEVMGVNGDEATMRRIEQIVNEVLGT